MPIEPIDPTDPQIFHDDEPTEPTDIGAAADGDRNVEAPEADTAEQRTHITPDGDEEPIDLDPTTANPADVAEQYRIVETDEDDYR